VDKKKIQELALIVLISLLVGVLVGMVAGKAEAADLNAAGPAKVAVGGAAQTNLLFDANTTSGLPVAIMVYAGDGGEFWIKRNSPGVSTLETIPIKVPAGSSIIIPVSGWQVKRGTSATAYIDTFRVMLNVNAAAVTDTVFAVPMYK